MSEREKNSKLKLEGKNLTIAGIVLIATGVMIILEQKWQTGWLVYVTLLAATIPLMILGIRVRQVGYLLLGCLILGAAGASFFFWSPGYSVNLVDRIGPALISFGVGWFVLLFLSKPVTGKLAYWTLVPGGAFISTGACFIFSSRSFYDFALYIGVGISLSILVWGIVIRSIGLLIPGCILSTIGPGIFFAWGIPGEISSLARTGTMLVSFAFGWGLITVLSRLVMNKFVWWPLIPGGTIAVVGWGLYIGGNPSDAQRFIGNSGSIGLMILGIYLLLMRVSMKR